MARSLFLRGLAIVYLIAFISLLLQVNGLIGSNGILPVSDYLDTIDSEYGNTGYALFSFQWDALLLETGFAAILLTPWGFRPAYKNPPRSMAIWLYQSVPAEQRHWNGCISRRHQEHKHGHHRRANTKVSWQACRW